ncbi:unnamed protein product [Allacma fusca]|uniref:CUB domain-containing protein n=1 Tax=Allacma fusca TaxID=39272 RepID=A0A8J2KF90_9HEXA|nr:unnamed protein product [Allacma fusca]
MERQYIFIIAGLGILLLLFVYGKNPGIKYNFIVTSEVKAEIEPCGGVIYASNGTINYKLGEPFKSGERCTWTIHSPNATKISFQVVENGFIQSNMEVLKVGYFLDSDYKTIGNYQEVVLNYSSYNNSVDVPGPVAFVRFHPMSLTGLGFSLVFSSVSSGISLPFKYRNFHVSSTYGKINYPGHGKSYQPLERVTILLNPPVSATLALKYFYGDCGVQQDYLSIYKWGRYGYNDDSLNLLQQFCNSSISSIPSWTIQSTEVLITFHSSISGKNRGFEFIWVP